MITIDNPNLEKIIISNAKKRNISIELYIADMLSSDVFDIDLKLEDEKYLSKELLDQINESRKSDRSGYIDLNEKYA